MRILGPLLALLLSLTLPLRATLVPGSEKPVTAPRLDVAAFDQSAGKLASDGNSFLAVWISHTRGGIGDVHATQVTPAGKRVEDEPILVAATEENEDLVDIAYGGGRYLVVWSTPAAMRARFVSDDRSMSDVIEIATLTKLSQPYVAFNGNRFLVVWDAVTVYRGALLETDGAIVEHFDVASTDLTGTQVSLVAANSAFRFVTSVVDFGGVPNSNGYPSNVGYRTIDDDGDVSSRVLVAPATTPVFDLRAVSNGSEFVIGWTTAISIPGGTVRVARVDAFGTVQVETMPTEGMYLHDVGVDPFGFFAIYGADTTKYIRRLGATQSAVLPTPGTKTLVLDVARNSTRAVVLVKGGTVPFDWDIDGGDLYLTPLDTGESQALAVAPRHQSSPDVAAAGELRLAAWSEYIGTDRRLSVVAARLDASGNTIDVNGIDLHANQFDRAIPHVASNGTDWLVVWHDLDRVLGSRIAHDGTLLDAAPFVIHESTDTYTGVAVSWDGAQYVVVYLRGINFRGVHTVVHARRVTAQGAVGPELTLSTNASNMFPSIASGSNGSLIVWHTGTVFGATSVAGVLLSRTGTVTNLAFPETTGSGFGPAVAWNGSTYLVAARYNPEPFKTVIRWQFVSPTGVVTTPVTPFVESAIGSTLEAEGHAGGFLLFWNGDASLYTARLDAQGMLAEGPRFVAPVLNEFPDRVGASGNLLVYGRRIGHSTRELARVFARTIHIVSGNPRRRAASH